MAENILITLCEGPHDVAFLYKILKSDGFSSYENSKLSDYPAPMNSLIIQEVRKSNYEELNLHTVRQALIPSAILKKGSNSIFLYSIGGDTKKDVRQSLIKEFVSFLPREGKIEVMPKETKLNITYFFDADEKGTDQRKSEIEKEIKEIIEVDGFNESKVIVYRDLKIGSYIFSDEDDKGKLEDILVPIMKLDNEEIFDRASEYYNNLEVSNRGKTGKKDLKKSVIGIAGQLQNSGATNTVTIRHSDYITDEKIGKDVKCQSILTFINDFMV